MTAPIPCRWTGEAFEPFGRFRNKCDAEFVVGQIYNMEEITERSTKSHRFYFASLNEAWQNLPEDQAERFATVDHLRKYALIQCRHRDERQFVASSKAEAVRVAAFLRPADDYSVVSVKENIVTVYTAKSQSLKAMGREAFELSKSQVLDYVAGLIGVKPEDLGRNAREAA